MEQNKKKVLLVSQYFYPENFKGNDIAFELVRRGYEVDVLTAIPNYPEGHFYKGYGFFKKKNEVVNGVKVRRIFTIPRMRNKIGLVLNYLVFWFWGMILAFFLSLFHKYDCVFVQQLSPVMSAYPGMVVASMQHIPLYVWILDLWPESLTATLGIKNKLIVNTFSSITCRMYKKATKLLMSSKGFKKSILDKGDFSSKLVYFPNWAEDVFTKEKDARIPEMPSGFKLMFAGNIGEAQDFENIMKAALVLKEHKDIHFVIVGDGRKKEWAETFCRENALESTVHFMERYPIEMMPSFFEAADCMLVSLKDDFIFNLTVPAKVQAYMASSKPIIGMINGETQEIISEAQCGMCSDAGDVSKLVNNIIFMSKLTKIDLKAMGENGYAFYDKYFCKQKCMNHLCEIID